MAFTVNKKEEEKTKVENGDYLLVEVSKNSYVLWKVVETDLVKNTNEFLFSKDKIRYVAVMVDCTNDVIEHKTDLESYDSIDKLLETFTSYAKIIKKDKIKITVEV